jgi:isopenicillin-N epimerase
MRSMALSAVSRRSLEIEGVDPGALTAHLMSKYKIFTTPINHDEFRGVRVTPNVYTTLRELDRFCEAMELVARKGLPA